MAVPVLLNLLLMLACAPTIERPTGLAGQFSDAKEMFKRGKFDRCAEFTETLANASPPNKFTDRARALRAVMFTGLLRGYKDVAEAYSKAYENARDPHQKSAYGRQRHDTLQIGGKYALGLGEAVQQLTQGGTLPKEVTLEAYYPATEGPIEVRDLARMRDGGWVPPEQQEAALLDSVRKGIDDSLADVVGGDRAKVRSVLASGSVHLSGVDFALYLGHALLEGATFFDRKHIRDSQRCRTLLSLADQSAKAGAALLKGSPNEGKEAELRKLQDQIKTAQRAA